jgi:hypothetical protein
MWTQTPDITYDYDGIDQGLHNCSQDASEMTSFVTEQLKSELNDIFTTTFLQSTWPFGSSTK